MATLLQQNRTEALIQSRRLGERWRAGTTLPPGNSTGLFLNGTAYTLTPVVSAYGASGSSLQQLAITLGWKEPDPNAITPRSRSIKDVYFKY